MDEHGRRKDESGRREGSLSSTRRKSNEQVLGIQGRVARPFISDESTANSLVD